MAERMQALVWRGPGEAGVEQVERPQAVEGWAVVDVAYAGICGTDLHICAGEHPRAQAPLIIGHELVGRVSEDTNGMHAGAPVAVEPLLSCGRCQPCRGGTPHICQRLRLLGIDVPGGVAEQVAVPVDRLIPLPSEIDLWRAAFVEPLAVAVHAVRRAQLRLGDDVLVAGAGPVGQAVLACALLSGAGTAYVSEPSPQRRSVASQLGAQLLDPDDPVGHLRQRTEGNGVPVVFDTAAVRPVATALTSWAAVGGRIVLVGTYSEPTPVDLQTIVFHELEAVGCRVYTRDDFEAAIALIAGQRFDPAPVLTSVVPLADSAQALQRLRDGLELKVLIKGSTS